MGVHSIDVATVVHNASASGPSDVYLAVPAYRDGGLGVGGFLNRSK